MTPRPITRVWIRSATSAALLAAAGMAMANPGGERGTAVLLKPDDFRQDRRFHHQFQQDLLKVEAAVVLTSIAKTAGIKVITPNSDYRAKSLGSGWIFDSPAYEQKLVLACRKAPMIHLMQGIALALNAGWYRVGDIHLLSRRPEQAEWICSTFTERSRKRDLYVAQVRALSPAQLALLGAQSMLRVEDLTPVQRQALLGYARSMYSGSVVDESATRLRGVHLRYTPTQDSVTGVISPEVSIMLPTVDGGFRSWIRMPLSGPPPNLRTTQPDFPAYPLPFLDSPEFEEKEVPALRADLQADKRLSAKIAYRIGTVTTAAEKVVRQTGIDLILSTGYDFWPVTAREANLTARQLLMRIETVTGGTWCKSGSIYVLRPRQILERSMRLEPSTRQKWLQAAAQAVRDGFGVYQRERLANQGWLEPERLNDRQRYALKWLSALAFASKPGVSPTAVDLQGVVLENVPRDEKTRQPRKVRFLITQVGGQKREVARLPLE